VTGELSMSQKPKNRYLKHVKTKKQEIKISEKEKELLERYTEQKEDVELTADEATVLEILNKRKTVMMITLEINVGLEPLGKPPKTDNEIRTILNKLHDKKQVKAVTGGDGQVYWVDVKHFRKKLLGTDKL